MMMYRIGLAMHEWNIEGPEGLMESMPDWQLYRWIEYFQLEPFGDKQQELRSAIGFSEVANSIRAIAAGLGRGKFIPIGIEEFMPSERNRPRHDNTDDKPRSSMSLEEFREAKEIFKQIGKPVVEGV